MGVVAGLGAREAASVSGVEVARGIAARYLALADRLLPERIQAFYLVGSTALGAFRDGRSDVDFVAVVDRTHATSSVSQL